ncbi:MAG: hypothetical protein PHO15_11175 [Eubacteriales bacterium]|nr:hypothetical protein [Eubacteriales bacterium]
MNMTKREKTLVFFVLILAVVGAYYLLFLKPYLEDMSDILVEKANKEILVTTNDQQEQKVKLLEDDIAALETELADYSGGISQGFDHPPVLVYLEETVNEYAQKVMFYFDDVSEFGQMEVCPVTVTMSGTYEGMKSILEAFSDSEYFIKVTSLSAVCSSTIQAAQTDEVYDPSQTEEPAPEIPVASDTLDITLTLEFYSMAGDIPEDKTYEFDDVSFQYGGDIFY